MASSEDCSLSIGSLLVDLLRMKPELIEQLAGFLDRETWVRPNWMHLSRELNVDIGVIEELSPYTESSPTIKLFKYLKKYNRPDTIQQLKQALLDMRRDDLCSLLENKGFFDYELVSKEIVSRKVDASSTRFGALDELAHALDGDSLVLGNWINLALKLGIPVKFPDSVRERSSSIRKSSINLFEYLSITYPKMAIKSVKEALEVMKRDDVLEIIQDQYLQDELLIKDLVTYQSDVMTMLADRLSVGQVPWDYEWRRLARQLKIPYAVYRKFEWKPRKRRKSPTKKVLQWLVERIPDITLTEIIAVLDKIKCSHAIQIIKEHFPNTVEFPLEIRLRGPLAVEAYNKALIDGKAYVKRLPIMLIGQDNSGKTSLKRSLTGKPFNPDEDSTVGIDVDPSHIKVSTEIWKARKNGDGTELAGGVEAISFEQHAARLVADDLKREKSVLAVKKMNIAISGSSEVCILNNSSQLFSPSDEVLGDPQVIPEVPSDPYPRREEQPPVESPRIPNDVAKLIKKLINESENVQDDDDIYAILWDFGGQSVYYATHPLFITARAIYLLVYDLSRDPYKTAKPLVKQGVYKKNLDSHGTKTNMDYLEFWMTSVASLGSETEDQHVRLGHTQVKVPPVFLVCTHADEPHRGTDPSALAREVFGSLQTKRFKNQLYEDVFVVDNTKSAGLGSECSEVTRLREKVLAIAKELPQMKEAIPIKWLKYERALQGTARKGYKWISLSMAKQIASEVCNIDNDQEFLTLLNFLHDQRILVHFDDTPMLNSLVVLDPQWLVDVFKMVITVKPYDQEESEFKELWLYLESKGILDEKLLEHVWGPLLSHQETSASLLAILEKFSLLCPWPSSDPSSGKQYLVPSMLMSHPPKDIIKLVASAQIPSLFFRFQSGLVPPGFFPRLVLQFFQWGQDEFWSAENPQLYADFARFYISEDDDCSVILLCHSSSVEVVVHRGNLSASPTEYLQSKLNLSEDTNYGAFEVACARAVRRQLALMLECMRKEFCWLKKMKYEVSVICPVCCQGRKVNYCSTHLKQYCEQEECLHFWSEPDLRSAKQFIRCRRYAAAQSDKVNVKMFAPWIEPSDEQILTDESEEKLPASGGGIDERVLSLPSKALQTIMSQLCDSREIVLQLKDSLKLDQASLEQPDPGTKRLIRCLANKAKQSDRLDVVKHLREIVPAGTTGPLLPEHLDIGNIPVRQMTDLAVELSGGEEWKLVAEELGLSPREIRYIDKRVMNPCEAVLAYVSRQCSISVGELYDRLNKCGLSVTADLL